MKSNVQSTKSFEPVNNIENEVNTKITDALLPSDNQEIVQHVDQDANVYDKCTLIKGILLTVSILVMAINAMYGILISDSNVSCIYDWSFEVSKNLNKFFADNKSYRHALLITSSVLLDVNLLIMSYLWIFKGKSWRLMITIYAFYGIRAFFQVNLCLTR